MTDLQLKIMEYSDKTIGLGCYIKENKSGLIGRYVKKHFGCKIERNEVVINGYDLCNFGEYSIIGHPYGWERLTYLHSKTCEDESYYELVCESRNNLFRYVYERREIMIKPCIDRPEDSQKLVLQFLETLPKS